MSRLKKFIYQYYGGALRWILKPALSVLVADLINMIGETRSRLAYHEENGHSKGANKAEVEKALDDSIKINQGDDLSPVVE